MQDPLYQFISRHSLPYSPNELAQWLETNRGGVYFLHSPLVGLTKVGRAENFHSRLKTIQAMNADTLQFVGAVSRPRAIASYRTPEAELEEDLHKDFADSREHGEWFRLDDPGRWVYACRVDSDIMQFGCTVFDFLDLFVQRRKYEAWREQHRQLVDEGRKFIRNVSR